MTHNSPPENTAEPVPATGPLPQTSPTSPNPSADSEAQTKSVPPRFEHRNVAGGIDQQLVQQTKDQIRGLIQEITELAQSDCSTEEFYEGFLLRTTSALASVGGAIWIREPDQKHLSLHYHINLKQTKLATDSSVQTQHTLLLNKLMESGEPTIVPANSGSDEDDAGNATDHLLVIAPLVIDQETIGLVEILQRTGTGPATQRGYLRFLTRMCTIASDFLRNRRLRSFSDQQTMWQRVEQFIRAVHQGLDPKQTAYTIANEGRRLVECDRVSVAMAEGARFQVKAVSGLDTIERRAEQVKLLGRLSTTVCKAGETLWYSGDSTDLPPQIEKRLHEYIDKSHTKMLAIVPLRENLDEDDPANSRRTPRTIGALIIEQLNDARIEESTENRVAVVAEHGQSALHNSLEHNSIFLMPVWRATGKMLAPFRRSNLPKTMIVLAMIAMAGLALATVPYSFSLSANGKVIPVNKVEVYAKVGGTLKDILAPKDPYTTIEEGFVLAEIDNNDLMGEIETIDGQLKQAREDEQKAIRAQSQRLDTLDAIQWASQEGTARKRAEGLEKVLAFKLKQAENLQVRSPIRGQVVNWQPRRTLLGRPVSRGQNLMTVVAPDTLWEIELEMPEKRVGHLFKSLKENDGDLVVKFSLVSTPGREFVGKVIEVNRVLEVKSDDGNTATVRVKFDNQQVPNDLLRAGTRVRAKVECGTRSIGYVLFHELIETTRTNLMYWF